MAQELIGILGIDQRRLRLEWVSSSEGARFAEVVTGFTEQIKELGPCGLKQAA